MEYAKLCQGCKEKCKQEKHIKIIACKDYRPKNVVKKRGIDPIK